MNYFAILFSSKALRHYWKFLFFHVKIHFLTVLHPKHQTYYCFSAYFLPRFSEPITQNGFCSDPESLSMKQLVQQAPNLTSSRCSTETVLQTFNIHYELTLKIKHVSDWGVLDKVKDFSKVGKNALNTTGRLWPLEKKNKINIVSLSYLGIEIKSSLVLVTDLIDINSPVSSVFNIH